MDTRQIVQVRAGIRARARSSLLSSTLSSLRFYWRLVEKTVAFSYLFYSGIVITTMTVATDLTSRKNASSDRVPLMSLPAETQNVFAKITFVMAKTIAVIVPMS